MHNIITVSTGEIRGIARNKLNGHWKEVFLGMLLYYIILQLVAEVLGVFLGVDKYPVGVDGVDVAVNYSIAEMIYTAVMQGPLIFGMSWFMVRFFRYKDINAGYIFNGFSHFIKSFALMFMQGLMMGWMVILGYLIILVGLVSGNMSIAAILSIVGLLVVLGGAVYMIIKALAYSQSFFLMVTNIMDDRQVVKKSVMECLSESNKIMKGNKGKLFVLILSYIGWGILAMIPGLIINTVGSSYMSERYLNLLVTCIDMVPLALLYSYYNTASIVFHDLLTGKLIIRNNPSDEFRNIE